MHVVINDYTRYRTIGIGGNTVFGWPKERMVSDVEYQNCRGWRLFSPAQAETMRTERNHGMAISRNS
jgi:hypothetical protein